jgi:hypothetical protein
VVNERYGSFLGNAIDDVRADRIAHTKHADIAAGFKRA